ncbi:Ig-like domain-containing protein [uncultured Maribacter sp.]|uniref:Ig-like domain-containing protein n=1 Tax=uncultured Maribacter sp. TaxID=431308 RepID=UPI00263925BC|nr:Ig-like domain-containing protein [uncultured Maribacter sp.]
MKLNQKSYLLRMLSIGIVLSSLLVSCSKDSDLLSEYVINHDTQNITKSSVVDDNFIISPGNTQSLDVLENDNFSDEKDIVITSVSNPINGDITVKENNTIEYIAPNSSNRIVDTFTYTTETKDNNGETTIDTGNVTIVVNEEEDKLNYFFTDKAKVELKKRFENGYIAGSGFNDDISEIILNTTLFAANPSEYRPVFGLKDMSQSYNGTINNSGHSLHTTAVYAYAVDNVNLANIVANEILAIVNTNDLYSPYWNSSNTIRWDNTEDQLWVQASTAKKLKNSYFFIKQLQEVLTDSNKSNIEAWFKRFAELGYNALKSRMSFYFGNNWEFNGVSKFYAEGVYPKEYGSTTPIQDASGKDLYTIAWAQDHFNNRNWDIIAYIHSWSVGANNLEMESWCREFFKISLKYGLFPDGTWWEMQRNIDEDPAKGVYYGWVSLGAMVQMAHLDASANHFPNDRLYDYKTTEGILKGSTNLTVEGFKGTSTTDGITEKSLLTFLTGQGKYLRKSIDGGWNDIRFFKNSSGALAPLSTVGTRQPSAVPAMANLYYKSQDLKDLYMYNTAVGYPAKVVIGEGYMAGVADEDSGPWGNLIFGSMWYNQEDNFFN